ncbi:hypothetical protein Clacol_005550 [Clathrus columnatus]|uniref:Uncharacterized protein n=1 Tax=Clathrus columnatus TaxID=1419009 RepID=A0AAV5ADW9_9AGAM|nr:hypothetical protein Clacol_005550 [Clathrus columnatus]
MLSDILPRGFLSQIVSDFAALSDRWGEPREALTILTLIGGSIIQSSLAQLVSSTPYHFTPVAFSFGWVAYAFSAILQVIGSRRLAPNPDCDCTLIEVDEGYSRTVKSWPLSRLVRDYELPSSSSDTPRGLTLSFYQTSPRSKMGFPDKDWVYYLGVFIIISQLAVAVIPGVLFGNWTILSLTFGGELLVQVHASLPQWRKELWGAREITELRNPHEVVCLTQGNGSPHVIVIRSDHCGIKLSDLAAGREVQCRSTFWSTHLLATLWLVHLFILGGVKRNTWYLLVIGAMGMVQNAIASVARRTRGALGFHLDQVRVVHNDKVFAALQEAEEVESLVGVRLTDVFFPGGLRSDEEVWKQEKLNKYVKEKQTKKAMKRKEQELLMSGPVF